VKLFLASLLIIFSLTNEALASCTLPNIDFGYRKPFYGTNYSFTYSDGTKKLYFVYPDGTYTLYLNVSATFARGFTYIKTTPDQFLTSINKTYDAVLTAEDCTPLTAENGEVLLAS
jgi:hypothetical protein